MPSSKAGKSIAFTARDVGLVEETRETIINAWSAPNYYEAIARAVEALVPEVTALVATWMGSRMEEGVPLFPRTHRIYDLPWITKKIFIKHRPFDPNGDPLANQVVAIRDFAGSHPDLYERFKALVMDPLGIIDSMRMNLYRRVHFVATVNLLREGGADDFSSRDKQLFQAVSQPLVDGLAARLALDNEHLSPGMVENIAEAMGEPAFIMSDSGVIIHANAAARMVYPRCPEWVRQTTAQSECPPWARRVPLAFEHSRLYLVIAEVIDVEPDYAPFAPWALQWKLPPRYARVAAHVMRGRTDKEIAEKTKLKVSTVRTYVREILRRAGVHSRAELTRKAIDTSRSV
ncbi:response regulator transcription factor [Myxococcota bacterium]